MNAPAHFNQQPDSADQTRGDTIANISVFKDGTAIIVAPNLRQDKFVVIDALRKMAAQIEVAF